MNTDLKAKCYAAAGHENSFWHPTVNPYGATDLVPPDLGPIRSIAVDHTSCVVHYVDNVWKPKCWGNEEYDHMLKDPPEIGDTLAVVVLTIWCNYALTANHSVYGWGAEDGLHGVQSCSTSVPEDIQGEVAHIYENGYSACVLLFSGSVKCWTPHSDSQWLMVVPEDVSQVVEFTMSWSQLCSLDIHGHVKCWVGREDPCGASKVPEGAGPFKSIKAMDSKTVGVTMDGKLVFWPSSFDDLPTGCNRIGSQDELSMPADLQDKTIEFVTGGYMGWCAWTADHAERYCYGRDHKDLKDYPRQEALPDDFHVGWSMQQGMSSSAT